MKIMKRMKSIYMKYAVTMLIAALVIGTFMALATSNSAAEEVKYTFYYVDHGTPGNPFWTVYFKGIEDATEWLVARGVKVKHLSASADLKKQIDMLKVAVAADPDGIITTMIDPKSFDPILKPAIERGIPLMAANVEDPRPREERIPYLCYYGEDTWKSGVEVAQALVEHIKKTGGFEPKHALLCNPQAGHYVWEARLEMFGKTLKEIYGTTSEKIVIGEDPTKALEIIKSYLVKHPETDVICATNWATHFNVDLMRELGKEAGKDVYLTSFDTMPELLEDIKEGKVVCTHDQQQYLQGFLPLIDMYLYKVGTVHPFGIVSTGPIIVDANNVDEVMIGVKAGYR